MSHELKWYASGKVLCLSVQGGLSSDEMEHINQRLTMLLDNSESRLQLVIDMSEMVSAYHTAQELRRTQAYMDHLQLETIIVVANSKLNRLIALLAFGLARARFMPVDSRDSMRRYMRQHGFSETSAAIRI